MEVPLEGNILLGFESDSSLTKWQAESEASEPRRMGCKSAPSTPAGDSDSALGGWGRSRAMSLSAVTQHHWISRWGGHLGAHWIDAPRAEVPARDVWSRASSWPIIPSAVWGVGVLDCRDIHIFLLPPLLETWHFSPFLCNKENKVFSSGVLT